MQFSIEVEPINYYYVETESKLNHTLLVCILIPLLYWYLFNWHDCTFSVRLLYVDYYSLFGQYMTRRNPLCTFLFEIHWRFGLPKPRDAS